MKKRSLVLRKVVVLSCLLVAVLAALLITDGCGKRLVTEQEIKAKEEAEMQYCETLCEPVALDAIGLEGSVLLEPGTLRFVRDLGLKETIYRNGDLVFLRPSDEEIASYLETHQLDYTIDPEYDFFYDENRQVVVRHDLMTYILENTNSGIAETVGLPDYGPGPKGIDMGNGI